ncbi:putative ABC transport system permease protein [Amycolatopsis endophytica]|uniref:Putative ABC transport system permease protein n=1 Tax=Amycolatopsis endophytica TaxID=860233 RepID=A0A853B7Y2_9PSEU|nr:ABC transporter permease [Amycolatopsis endophytica]NYI90847.1 putative ABC transport system permease protein [Amycolatopsis endophytica]
MKRWGLPSPWARAPWMLLRRPAISVAVAAAAFLVALPAAAAALFLSAAGNASLRDQTADACPAFTGAHVEASLEFTGASGARQLDRRVRALTEAGAPVPRLSGPVVTLTSRATVGTGTVSLVARDGFADNVTVLDGGSGPGLWLPDGFAGAQGIRVGDQVPVALTGRTAMMPVAAVYADLRSQPDRPYWCGLVDLYRGKPLGEVAIYPLALVSRDDFLALADGTGSVAGTTVELAVNTDGLTTANVHPVLDGLQRLRDDTNQAVDRYPGGVRFSSGLPAMAERADLVVGALTGTVVPLAAAATLAGLVVAGAAGGFWVDRRRAELTVLSARGAGPVALAGKAVLEVALVVAAGAVGGWFAARALVGSAGPIALFTPAARAGSVWATAGAFVVTLGAIALVAARRTAHLFDVPPVRAHRRSRMPWEVLPLAGAVVSWFVLGDDVQTGSAGAGTVAHVPPRLVVAPILLVIALALGVARLTRWMLARARARGGPAHAGLFLATRRVLAGPVAAAVLIGATAVPVALAVYGASVTGSVERTLHAEGQLIVGTDVVFSLEGPAPVPPALVDSASAVSYYNNARVGGTTVEVIGVDPATFGRAAFWDPALPGPSLDDLLGRLASGEKIAVLAGATRGASTVDIGGRAMPLTVVGVPQLPGKKSGNPLLMVRQDVLDGLGLVTRPQLWVRGDPDRILPAVAGLPVRTYAEAASVTAAGVYSPITYTFGFLAAVSLLCGAIIIVGLLLYLTAKARARRSAYVLLKRMSVSAADHWRSLFFEVGGLLLAGFVAGLALAAVAVAFTYGAYDLNPATVPGTVLDVPWGLVGGLAAAAVVTTMLAAAVAQRAVSRARPAEVLRDSR